MTGRLQRLLHKIMGRLEIIVLIRLVIDLYLWVFARILHTDLLPRRLQICCAFDRLTSFHRFEHSSSSNMVNLGLIDCSINHHCIVSVIRLDRLVF